LREQLSSFNMADKPDKTTKSKKRIVKNPESFRERAVKATTEVDNKKPRLSRSKQAFKALFRPFRTLARAIGSFPPFKPLRRPLRIIGLIIFPAYFRNSWKELKLVTWPGFKESIRLTWAVLLFAIIFGTTVALVDYGLNSVFKHILLK
jgi:preprotein translocase SecE subunit